MLLPESGGFENLVAGVMNRAVLDAKRIHAGKLSGRYRASLVEWMGSGRFEMWCYFVGLDPDRVEERIRRVCSSGV
jgi:hypothetical protein